MKNGHIIFAGIGIVALLWCAGTVAALEDNSPAVQGPDSFSIDIAPYNGTIGPDSPLYGLKVAMEDLDETFTFNDTWRVEKQVDHAQTRISEVRKELELNRTGNAERALEQYRQKLNLTETSLARFRSNTTGLLHAQEMIASHQAVLADLLPRYPNSAGLARAYNNSLAVEQKFGEKTQMRFDWFPGKNNKTFFKAVKWGIRDQNPAGGDTPAPAGTTAQAGNETRDRIKDKTTADDTGNHPAPKRK